MKRIHRIKRTRRNHMKKNNIKGGKQLESVNCSPKEKDDINEFSCYTNDSLLKLRDKWNARHPDSKIKSNNPKEIHRRLSEYLSDVCNKESCWLKQSHHFSGNISKDLKESFAPITPREWKKNPNEWLSSVDIMKVMKQYERAYKCFDFIGPSPIDFNKQKLYGECVWEELCNFSLQDEIKKGRFKIGIIFNTDPHDKPGQHWISMFINIKKNLIFFFDSTGDPAPKEILQFVDNIKQQGKLISPRIEFKYDTSENTEHQNGNTECGIYSLFFIVQMLEDKMSTKYLKTHRIDDNHMSKFRKIYFNESL
jgi:hypothetical protein